MPWSSYPISVPIPNPVSELFSECDQLRRAALPVEERDSFFAECTMEYPKLLRKLMPGPWPCPSAASIGALISASLWLSLILPSRMHKRAGGYKESFSLGREPSANLRDTVDLYRIPRRVCEGCQGFLWSTTSFRARDGCCTLVFLV